MHKEINQETVDFSDVNALPTNKTKYQSSIKKRLFFFFFFSFFNLNTCPVVSVSCLASGVCLVSPLWCFIHD